MKLAHESEGISKAASSLISAAPAPCNATTLELLRGKDPPESQAVILSGVQDSLTNRQGTIKEVEEPFCPEDLRATIKKASP